MKLIITCTVIAILIVLGLGLGAQNDVSVPVNYLIAQGTFPLTVIVACVLIVGFLLGLATVSSSYLTLKLKHGQLSRKYRKLQQQIDSAT